MIRSGEEGSQRDVKRGKNRKARVKTQLGARLEREGWRNCVGERGEQKSRRKGLEENVGWKRE